MPRTKTSEWAKNMGELDLQKILSIARYNKCPMPRFLPKKAWDRLFALLEKPQDFAWYLGMAEDLEEAAPDADDREAGDLSEEESEELKNDRQQEQQMYQRILWFHEAQEKRVSICKALEKELLSPERMRDYLKRASDEEVEILFDLCQRREEGPEHALSVPRENYFALDSLALYGFVILRERPAQQDESCQRTIYGCWAGEEILSLFESVWNGNKELDEQRRQYLTFETCFIIVCRYYEVVTLEAVRRVFQNCARLCKYSPEQVSEMSGEDFVALWNEYTSETNRSWVSYRGVWYYMDPVAMDNCGDEEAMAREDDLLDPPERGSLFGSYVHSIEEWNQDFYIPDEQEIKNALECPWRGLEPYQRMEEIVRAYYLEEFEMSNAFFSLIRDEDGYCGGYTMDSVEKDIWEIMDSVYSLFALGIDEEQTAEELEPVTGNVKEEFVQELHDLLPRCREVTHCMSYLGQTPKAMAEKYGGDDW